MIYNPEVMLFSDSCFVLLVTVSEITLTPEVLYTAKLLLLFKAPDKLMFK